MLAVLQSQSGLKGQPGLGTEMKELYNIYHWPILPCRVRCLWPKLLFSLKYRMCLNLEIAFLSMTDIRTTCVPHSSSLLILFGTRVTIKQIV